MARLPYLIPYDPEFLGGGFRVPLPSTRCRGNLTGDGMVLDYIHSSLVMHRQRRTAVYAAHNIDVSQRRVVAGDGWALDTRIPSADQTGPAAYLNNPWDRGHLVRRAAVAWGSPSRAQDASDATFFYTNAAPQHERFNRDEWVQLEDWVLDTAGGASNRLCVFTGPLFTVKDQTEGSTRIPSAFWKITVLRDATADGSDLAVLGFVMKQNDFWDDWNGSSLLDLHVYQVGVADIGLYTGLEFGGLAELDEFEWRQARFRDRSRMGPIPINGPDDIDLKGTRRRRARGVRALRYVSPGEAEAATGGQTEAAAGGSPASADASASAASGGWGLDETSGDCGCREADANQSTDERIEELGRQVAALRDLVEGLLEEDRAVDERTRSILREGARRTFARIVGGEMVGYGEFPDCACIGMDRRADHLDIDAADLVDGDTEWFCSGVLISDRVIVTAAHCAPSINRAFLGGRSLSYLGIDGEVARVERVLVHPEYHPDLVPSHDIAVLVLAEAVETPPAPVATPQQLAAQDDVMLVGFGYDHPTANVGFGTKRKVSVRRTDTSGDPDELVALLERTHGFDSAWELHAGIKGLGRDSCNGDSGGPAYVEADGSFVVAGITSRAAFSADTRCGDGGIYTRITPYLGWIHEVTGGLAGVALGRPEPGPRGSTALHVSAAQPNPAGPDAGYEWIEVTNGGSVPLSLDDYVLTDKQGGREALTGAIAAGATYRLTLPEGSKVKLANSGDEIVLLREDVEVHRVSYATAGKGEVIRFEAPESGAGGVVADPCAGAQPPAEGLPADADPC